MCDVPAIENINQDIVWTLSFVRSLHTDDGRFWPPGALENASFFIKSVWLFVVVFFSKRGFDHCNCTVVVVHTTPRGPVAMPSHVRCLPPTCE